MNKLQIGDNVMVRAGKYRTKTGKINRLDIASGKVWVEGINLVKKHQKKSQLHPRGGIISLHQPLPIAKVMLVDNKTKKPTRIGFKLGGKNKERIAIRSHEAVPAADKKK